MAGSSDKGMAISPGTRYAFGGMSGPVYDESDANANHLMFDMEPGGATHVPVIMAGIDIMGVDLGLFDGITFPSWGVVDNDRDSAVGLAFTDDDVAEIVLYGAATQLKLPTGTSLDDVQLSSPVITTDITLVQATEDYTLTWDDPAAARAISIPDPGGTDVFVFADMTQTLTGKTIDGDNNTLSNLAHGSEVDNPSSGVHGVTGAVVGTTDEQTLTNKTLTSPAINSPTGIGKGDVGLGNVDNTSDATKNSATATLTNKTLTSPVLTTPEIDDTSADHQYVFGVSELTADRTVTLPLLTGNDTFVFEAHTQTLTNKTLTAPVQNLAVNAQTGTTYTLVAGDASKLVDCNNGSAITLTVPPNSEVAFATGTQILVRQKGAGQVTISPGSGVTINAPSSANKTVAQYSVAGLVKLATDTWTLFGDTEA